MDVDLDLSRELPLAPLELRGEALEERFEALQRRLIPLWSSIERLSDDPQTIVVVPSISLDFDIPATLLQAYEERFLFILLLLRQPNAQLVYATSMPLRMPSLIPWST